MVETDWLAEKVILAAVTTGVANPEAVAYVLHCVEEEIARLRSDFPRPEAQGG